MSTRKAWLLVAGAAILFSACSSTSDRQASAQVNDAAAVASAPRDPAGFFGPSKLEDGEIFKASSSRRLKLSEAQMITDNDAAFEAKLESIRSARPGETVRLVYYIYSSDHSSSIFTNELLNAASRGVKVRLMVDYLTNGAQFDLFSMMEAKSQGRIQVRFYGRPTPLIMRDALFLTRPCPVVKGTPKPTQCADAKWAKITRELDNANGPVVDSFSGLFLSGLMTKNPLALKTSVLMGQQIDLQKFKEGGGSEEEKKELMEFFKLLYQARVNGDLVAAFKVQLALFMYGEDLKPILNELYGRIPLHQVGETSGFDWEHLTDFNHHKLLLVGDRQFVLGGRNIENSYHMKKNSLSAKYIFVDTDFAARVEAGGADIARAYDEIWDFSAMTISLDEVARTQPVDFVMNREAAAKAVAACGKLANKTDSDRAKVQACLKDELWANGAKSLAERIEALYQDMKEKIAAYEREYAPAKVLAENWKKDPQFALELSPSDLKKSLVTYIENVHFDRRKPAPERTRVFGAETTQPFIFGREHELKYGKAIHHLWLKGLENACHASKEDGRVRRVILHTAYFIPPANMMRTFAKMMDGTWHCKRVHVTFLTNSFDTTDLNVINIYTRYQMMAFFDVYSDYKKQLTPSQRAAKFDYYEYQPILDANGQIDPKRKISLHTKVSVLGDDLIVGSANGDVRSYYMDSNNGVYIRGARDLVRTYVDEIEKLLADPTRVKNLTPEHLDGSVTMARLNKEDEKIVDALLGRFNMKPKTKAMATKYALDFQRMIGKVIDGTTRMVLSKDYIEVPFQEGGLTAEEAEKIRVQQEKIMMLNRILQLL